MSSFEITKLLIDGLMCLFLGTIVVLSVVFVVYGIPYYASLLREEIILAIQKSRQDRLGAKTTDDFFKNLLDERESGSWAGDDSWMERVDDYRANV